MTTKMNVNLIFVVSAIAVSQACSNAPVAEEPIAQRGALSDSTDAPSSPAIWLGSNVVERDTRAVNAFRNLAEQQRAGRVSATSSLTVYELETADEVRTRAELRARTALGMAEPFRATSSLIRQVTTQGDHAFYTDSLSGAERFVDRARFHRGTGGSKELSETSYIETARQHVDRVGLSESDGRAGLYAYKLMRFKSASQSLDDKGGLVDEPVVTTDQISVTFAQEIGGVPVIGPGGKVTVHMTPNGSVVSHESTLRRTARSAGRIMEADLLQADAAEKQVRDRVLARGVDLESYTLSRAEFGYFRAGRHSIQTVLVPHYAFFFTPREGVLGRKIVEMVPATTDADTLARLAIDDQAEAARKRAKGVVEEDERPAF